MWLYRKLAKEEYEDVMMEVIEKLNEVIDYLEKYESQKKKL